MLPTEIFHGSLSDFRSSMPFTQVGVFQNQTLRSYLGHKMFIMGLQGSGKKQYRGKKEAKLCDADLKV